MTVSSQVRLFADDTAVYLTIGGAEDGKLLQNDLDRLSVWEDRWDMEFNPSKCQVVRVTSSRNPFNFSYTLHGQVLEIVTAVYLTIGGAEDGKLLQNDLDRLSVWEDRWDMEFNPSKCQVVRVTSSRNPFNFSYTLHGQVLEIVTSAKYLGVDISCISSGLSWNPHIDRISKTATRTLNFIQRNIKTKNQKVRETAYNTLVRPQLEYAAPVWDPYTKEKVLQLEKVQRRAARWTTSSFDYRSSTTEIVNNLGWRTLEQRRADARLCLFYKIVHGLVAVPLPDYIQPSNRISRYCHSMTFRQLHTTKNYYKYSFFPLAIVQWNALPETVACLPDLESFKVSVSKLQHSRP